MELDNLKKKKKQGFYGYNIEGMNVSTTKNRQELKLEYSDIYSWVKYKINLLIVRGRFGQSEV